MLDTKEIARRCNCSTRTVQRRARAAAAAGEPWPPSIKIGRLRRYPAGKFNAWLRDMIERESGQPTVPIKNGSKPNAEITDLPIT